MLIEDGAHLLAHTEWCNLTAKMLIEEHRKATGIKALFSTEVLTQSCNYSGPFRREIGLIKRVIYVLISAYSVIHVNLGGVASSRRWHVYRQTMG